MDFFTPTLQMVFYSVLSVSLMLILYRVLKGPHVLDRLVCLDFVALVLICMIAVWEVAIGTQDFFDAILLLAVVGFITTVALAKYVENGKVLE